MKPAIVFLALILIPVHVAIAQTVDAGRGPVPLRVPEGYDESKQMPLVVLLHGYTASGERQESYMNFSAVADEYGFLFIAPDGTQEASDRQHRFWNATQACCNFHGSDVDDSAYIRGLIDNVKAEYNVDPARVYLVGHSNGGFMSYRMAYDHSDTIAAIVSLAGASLTGANRPAPKHPVHVLQIHGTNDETIEYRGGDIGPNRYPSAEESVLTWAAYGGCDETVVTIAQNIDLVSTVEGPETTVQRYDKKCNPGASTELWTIQNGAHIPQLNETFAKHVVEWLYAHPKPAQELQPSTATGR